jgi:hypothetical protein
MTTGAKTFSFAGQLPREERWRYVFRRARRGCHNLGNTVGLKGPGCARTHTRADYNLTSSEGSNYARMTMRLALCRVVAACSLPMVCNIGLQRTALDLAIFSFEYKEGGTAAKVFRD